MKAMTLRNVDAEVAETLRRRARARIQEQASRRVRLRREIARRFGPAGVPSERLLREDRRR